MNSQIKNFLFNIIQKNLIWLQVLKNKKKLNKILFEKNKTQKKVCILLLKNSLKIQKD